MERVLEGGARQERNEAGQPQWRIGLGARLEMASLSDTDRVRRRDKNHISVLSNSLRPLSKQLEIWWLSLGLESNTTVLEYPVVVELDISLVVSFVFSLEFQ